MVKNSDIDIFLVIIQVLVTPPFPFRIRLELNNSLLSQELKFALNHKLPELASYELKTGENNYLKEKHYAALMLSRCTAPCISNFRPDLV